MEEIRGLIRSHPKSMIAVALFMFVALIGGASNALGGTRTVTKAVPGPVVTVTQAAKPAVTITPRPAPTVTLTPRPAPTVTVTPVPGPGTVLFSGTGSGDWNSAPFAVAVSEAGPVIRVTYSYWNNGSMGSADNFEADLVGGPDSEPIANTIAFSGRNTTTVYLDTQYAGTNKYHLEVVGSGSWSFRITQVS